MDDSNFPDRLLELRVKAGLSTSQLAKLVGVAQSTISRWETAKQRPRLADVVRLAKALNVPVESFLAEPGETKRPSKGRPRKAEPEEECCAAA